MKFLKPFLLVLALALVLSGCSFRLFSTAEELIYPVSPSGENANVQKALDNFFKDGYTLKTPVGGGYKSSYTFYDIDSDKQDEVVVFCEPSSNPGSINMAVIDKTDTAWNVVCNIEGEGSDIYSVDFRDLNGDKSPEMIILWDTFSNASSHVLSVYNQTKEEDKLSLTPLGKSITMNNYIAVDIEGNGLDELIVFTVDSGDSISANAVVYSYKNERPMALGTTKLDGHISSYKNIISENFEGIVRVYADAVKSNGSQMLTEVIVWSDYYDTIISPFYSYSTGITKDTTRSARLNSQDVDQNGKIEIPLDAGKGEMPVQTEAVDWNYYKESMLFHSCYSIAVEKDNYQMIIPDEYFENIAVSYDPQSSKLTISDDKERPIYEVISLLKSYYEENRQLYSDYTEIMSASGYVYLAVTGNDSDIKITSEDLKSMIKSYEGE